jgi:hypothetical protein
LLAFVNCWKSYVTMAVLPGSQLLAEAAAIPERSLIAAADELDVRAQRGQWWLPG